MKLSTACTITRSLMLLSVLLLANASNLYAQTTWTGTVSTAWNTAGNWSAGVPNAADDVTIPSVTNDPVISIANAVAKSVSVQSSGLLTISAAGSLTIDGATTQGLLNLGTVQNNGIINIGSISAVGANGLLNQAIFNNNSGAQLNISRTSDVALYNKTASGTLTNAGTITIGAAASSSGDGIYSEAVLNNLSTGQINVDLISRYAMYVISGSMTNQGTINIGSLAGGNQMNEGLIMGGSVSNTNTGQINISRTFHALDVYINNLSNAGTVTVGALGGVTNVFFPTGSGLFNNNTGGVFKTTGTIQSAKFANNGGTLSPGYSAGIMTFDASENFTNCIMAMEVNGTGTAGVNFDKVNVSGTATLGGTLAVSINYTPSNGDQINILTASAISGTYSTVTGLPANWNVMYTAVGVTLSYSNVVLNTWTGNVSNNWNTAGNWTGGVPDASDNVTIPNVATDPVISTAAAVAKSVKVQTGSILTLTAAGTLTINGSTTQALWNQGTVTNNGSIQIGNTGNVGSYGIYNDGVFNNNTGGQITINRATTTAIELLSNTFFNAGTLTIGNLVPVTNLMLAETGIFTNNTGGVLKATGTLPANNFTNAGGTLSPGYSPGKMNFNAAENFTSNTFAIEVNGTGVAGTNFDQIVVNGTATIGGTLAININYTATVGDQIVIVSASSVSGTFTNVTGLPTNWNVVYYPEVVVLSYGIPFSTWTGAVNNVWNTAGNWSSGVPNAATDVTIPNVTNDPQINVTGIVAKSITVQAGALLTVGASGSLNINGAFVQGLLNLGTVQNNGIINIGSISAVEGNGLLNQAVLNNNSGAQLNISRASDVALYNKTASGTLTNAGTITIGAAASSSGDGIFSEAILNNLSTGQINIDRISRYAIYIISGGSMTNQGTINIGSLTGGNQMNEGLIMGSSVSNTSTGQINISRAFHALDVFGNSLSNAGIVTVGALGGINNIFFPTGSGLFNNNTGGVFKTTGTIPSAKFANNGGTLSPGYSPGIMTFDASENFANCIMAMEVNGTGTAGVNYDQINVNGTATLGGTLALSINFAATQGNQVTLLSASATSGTFAAITGLLPNWRITYTGTTVLLTYDLIFTWTGAVNNNWNIAGNWSGNAVPNAESNVIIPNVTNDPIISTAGAVANTIHVQPGGILTLNATGSLTTNGVLPFNGKNAAIYNQGTMTIKGPLMVKPN